MFDDVLEELSKAEKLIESLEDVTEDGTDIQVDKIMVLKSVSATLNQIKKFRKVST